MPSKEENPATDATVTPVPPDGESPGQLARGSIQSPPEGLVGRKIGAYRILGLLGAGAMGEVYRGVHDELERPVAIKVLRPHVAADSTLVGRFFAEARAVNLIRHENIVECTDLIRDGDGCYMVMELLEGHTLAKLNEDVGKLPWTRAVGIAAQIAEAIAAAHEKGIIHRDLKPDNVFLIRRRESDDYVKILDFGIAHLNPEQGGKSATQTGHALGTPAYMSPEQVRGEKARVAADIYCLGVMLFEMVAGRLPFGGATAAEVMVSHLSEPAPNVATLTRVPERLAKLIRSMLQKDPAARPRAMTDVAKELRRLSGPGLERRASTTGEVAFEETAPSERLSGTEDTERPAKSESSDLGGASEGRSWLTVALAVGVLVIVGVVFIITHDGGDPSGGPVASVADDREDVEARAALDGAMKALGLPIVPADCQAKSAAERKLLVETAALIAGGRMGQPREEDRRAARAFASANVASPEALGLWARASLLAGETDVAREIATRAVDGCPGAALPHAVLGLLSLSAGHGDAAVAQLRRAVELAPEYLDARFNLGLALLATGHAEEAVEAFDRVVAEDDARPNLRLVRGEALLLLKEYQRAAADLSIAVDVCDDRGRAFLALGYAQKGIGRPDEARQSFCRGAELGNDKAQQLCPSAAP